MKLIKLIKPKKNKSSSHDMLHIDQSFKSEYFSSHFNFIVSFQYQEIYVAVFTTPFESNNSNFSQLWR